jgi:hypothetical protein
LHPPPAGLLSPLHPDTKTGPGEARPRTGSEKRQRKHVRATRLDDDELRKLEDRAGAAGQSVGAYMRACSVETAGPRARRRAPADRELLARTNAELNRVGNNLNQIARALNEIARNEIDSPRDRLAQLVGELEAPMRAGMAELTGTLAVIRQALGYDRQG